MSDEPDKTAIQFLSPIGRDSGLERLLTEVYRLQGEVDRLKSKVAVVEGRQTDHLALGSTVEGHQVSINDHDEKISGLARSVERIQATTKSIETSVDRIRENAALYGKAQERRDDKILEKLTLLVELHQTKAVA